MGRTLKPPLDLVLAWQTDAYLHGVRRDHTLLVLAIIFSAITFVVVSLRLIVRLGVQRNPGLDDVFIVPAMLCTIGLNAMIAYTSRHGFDRHVWDLTPEMGVDLRRFTFAISFLYIWGTALTKVSVLFFYRRLTGSLPIPFLWAVYACLAYVFCYIITFTFTLIFTCHPVKAYWMQVDFVWAFQNAEKYRCVDEGAELIATNASSITQDFLACIMPALLLWNLQVNRKQKIAMGLLLGVSIFPCIAGILRFIFLYRAAYTTYDIPWEMFDSWIWTLVEANVGLLCASVPALRVFLKRTLQLTQRSSRPEDQESGRAIRTIGSAKAGAVKKLFGGDGAGEGGVSQDTIDSEGRMGKMMTTSSTADSSSKHPGVLGVELKDLSTREGVELRGLESRDGCSGSRRTESIESASGAGDERRLVWWDPEEAGERTH